MSNAKSYDLLFNYLLSEHYDKLPIEKIFGIALQAKAMHKDEIVSAFNSGECCAVDYFNAKNPQQECSENYYNEKYGDDID